MKGVLLDKEGDYDCLWGDFESVEIVSLLHDATFTKFEDLAGWVNHSNSIVIIPEEFI